MDQHINRTLEMLNSFALYRSSVNILLDLDTLLFNVIWFFFLILVTLNFYLFIFTLIYIFFPWAQFQIFFYLHIFLSLICTILFSQEMLILRQKPAKIYTEPIKNWHLSLILLLNIYLI